MILLKKSILLDEQCLKFEGKPLDNDKTLSDYNIVNKSIFHLITTNIFMLKLQLIKLLQLILNLLTQI